MTYLVKKKGGSRLFHVNKALNISFIVSFLNAHFEDNTHLWFSALDRHLHLRNHYQRFMYNSEFHQTWYGGVLQLWLLGGGDMLMFLLLQVLSAFLPDVWDLTIFISWHQGLHVLISKLHLTQDEEDSDSKEEPLIWTRGPKDPLSSNHLVTWRNIKFNNIRSTNASPDGFRMCSKKLGYNSVYQTYPKFYIYADYYCVISLSLYPCWWYLHTWQKLFILLKFVTSNILDNGWYWSYAVFTLYEMPRDRPQTASGEPAACCRLEVHCYSTCRFDYTWMPPLWNNSQAPKDPWTDWLSPDSRIPQPHWSLPNSGALTSTDCSLLPWPP